MRGQFVTRCKRGHRTAGRSRIDRNGRKPTAKKVPSSKTSPTSALIGTDPRRHPPINLAPQLDANRSLAGSGPIGMALTRARLPGSADARALRVIGITGYTALMAKVMVSLPDDLLKAVDIEAERRGTTRSGLLREFTEETLRRRTIHRAERMAEINNLDGPITR